MNLRADARDAMPQGGTLTIVAENTSADQARVDRHAYGYPGKYVKPLAC
jgi:hypothetical protein